MGIWVHTSPSEIKSNSLEAVRRNILLHLEKQGLDKHVAIAGVADDDQGQFVSFQLSSELSREWAPDGDTTRLCQQLNLDTLNNTDDLEREILLAMLLSPVPFKFPTQAELASAVRIRKNVVLAARKTTLDFHTTEAERPVEYWVYDKDRGFTLLPGKSLITALQKATQPDKSGKLYSFSCYRATEYVILLGVAQELHSCNPALYEKLQQQWETKAIMSGKFHDVFLREHGSMDYPLPPKYYVPGDRLWFRNPDEHSSDVTGYEGSWVFYLGDGLFTNFWKPDSPYTLTTKCVEIFHWRNATWRDQTGELRIDENIVAERVCHSLKNQAEVESIMKQMLRLREPKGVYVNGGCIDTSREYPRCVCPGTSEMTLASN
jgi:Protein-glutamine gamma-glutamyltransferase